MHRLSCEPLVAVDFPRGLVGVALLAFAAQVRVIDARSILVNAVLRYLALPRHEKSGTPHDGAGQDGISAEDVDANTAVLKKIESIQRIVFLYQCETGVTPLYFAFPLLMLRERDVGTGKWRCIVAPIFI